MHPIKVIFFGSTSDSVIVLNRLYELQMTGYACLQARQGLRISAIVTQPPRPVGREQLVTPTPVEVWARDKNITVLSFPSNKEKSWTFENEQTVIDTLEPLKADLLVSASYGQKIPTKTITDATYGGLNVHPSLLPRFRGADPVPWAILSGDHQTGVTIVTLSPEFDEGNIIAQKKLPITNQDFSDPLRTRLFELGSTLLINALPALQTSKNFSKDLVLQDEVLQGIAPTPYARRLRREDGFEPWETIQKACVDKKEATRIDRKFRAFTPWPGLWTRLRQGYGGQANLHEKRLKILACHVQPVTGELILDSVQLEGKNQVSYEQFQTAYLRGLDS